MGTLVGGICFEGGKPALHKRVGKLLNVLAGYILGLGNVRNCARAVFRQKLQHRSGRSVEADIGVQAIGHHFHVLETRADQAGDADEPVCRRDFLVWPHQRFTDFDNNHIEICMNRQSLGDIRLSHVVLETTHLDRTKRFYSEALGLRPVDDDDDETSSMEQV